MCPARRVLVVDDHAAIRSVVERVLTLEGYVVRAARHGRAALEVIATFPPCVILLDLMMPVLDGRGFLAAYRQLPGADARVITMTAGGETSLAGEGLPAHEHVRKPFDVDELLATVGRHMALHAAGRAVPGRR
jgi:two-component system, chemotaxis family, chemotaxis protein CheY